MGWPCHRPVSRGLRKYRHENLSHLPNVGDAGYRAVGLPSGLASARHASFGGNAGRIRRGGASGGEHGRDPTGRERTRSHLTSRRLLSGGAQSPAAGCQAMTARNVKSWLVDRVSAREGSKLPRSPGVPLSGPGGTEAGCRAGAGRADRPQGRAGSESRGIPPACTGFRAALSRRSGSGFGYDNCRYRP